MASRSHGQGRAPGRGRGNRPGTWTPPTPSEPQLKLKITNYPPTADTAAIHRYFSSFGSIHFIRIDARAGQVVLAFNPPPADLVNFYRKKHRLFEPVTNRPFILQITPLSVGHATLSSPRDSRRTLPIHLTLQPDQLRVGVMTDKNALLALRAVQTANRPIVIRSHLKDRPELKIEFPAFRHGKWQTIELRSYFSNILTVRKNDDMLLLTFRYPPRFYAIQTDSLFRPADTTNWSKGAHFCRIADLETHKLWRDQSSTTPCRANHYMFIHPGRWLCWAFTFERTPRNVFAQSQLLEVFNAYNINLETDRLSISQPTKTDGVWHSFELHDHVAVLSAQRGRTALHTLQATSDGFPVLSFETRYAIDVCLSRSLLFEHHIHLSFLQRIADDEIYGRILLEGLALENKQLYEPMQLFELQELRQSRKPRVPGACVLMHSVTVTPTTMYVHPVQVEMSNRILRKFNDLSHRFLRVRFSDEANFGKLQPHDHNESDDETFERVRRTLVNGIKVAGRHYTFLASGNSQFRENGAYFFSNTETVTVNSIRQWMGFFQRIREIPKYVSRIGQCFTTTRAVTSIGVTPEILEIPDIERNGYNFTDGVGKLSPFLARMIAQELRLRSIPSLFQFRMGGCKGVLATDPQLSGRAVHIRPSQKKFSTNYNQLEVIRCSSYSSAYLNRQIILVLSSLGVPDDVFVKKLKSQLERINKALQDDETAISLLRTNVDFNQVTLSVERMIQAGMSHEPFVNTMLHLWGAWMKKSLKERMNIFIADGAFLLGCVDETATLQMHEDDLPEIFLQIPDLATDGEYKIVQGTCIIARNPASHLGDIRLVRAVDCVSLHHLKDVVVFPQLGARDLANMCSGGDLDGDDFLIIWDPDLIPPDHNVEPMDYNPPAPILSQGPVTQSDIMDFFCNYMRNDSLGTIAVAHRVWADRLAEGVKHETCIKLAQLHSQAVDYCKTGVPAQMDCNLRVKKYPHWHNKPQHQSYKSTRVLGRLHDEVDGVDYQPRCESHTFDERILNAYDLSATTVDEANALKRDYDLDMQRLMAQFGTQTEFEVWSAFVLNHNREFKAYKFAEEIGQLMFAHMNHYRDPVLTQLGVQLHDRDLNKLGPFVAAMYKATAIAVAAYEDEGSGKDPNSSPPMISFPWIFQDVLLGIARMVDLKSSLAEAMDHNVLSAKNWRCSFAMASARASTPQDHIVNEQSVVMIPTSHKRPLALDDSQIRNMRVSNWTKNVVQYADLERLREQPRKVAFEFGDQTFSHTVNQPGSDDNMTILDDEDDDEEEETPHLSAAGQRSAVNAFKQLGSLLGPRS